MAAGVNNKPHLLGGVCISQGGSQSLVLGYRSSWLSMRLTECGVRAHNSNNFWA